MALLTVTFTSGLHDRGEKVPSVSVKGEYLTASLRGQNYTGESSTQFLLNTALRRWSKHNKRATGKTGPCPKCLFQFTCSELVLRQQVWVIFF